MSALKKLYFDKKINLILFFLFIFFMVIYLFEVITPFFMAFIIAYITNPFKIFLDKYINKTLSSFLAIIALIISIYLLKKLKQLTTLI